MHRINSAMDASCISAELQLLAACAIRPSGEQIAPWLKTLDALSRRIDDWKEFARLVKRHQLPALAHDALRRVNVEIIPAEIRQGLELLNRASRLQSLAQIAESKRIAMAFDAANIAGVQLKGAPLSQRLYGDAFLRSSGDMDVLVSIEQINAATKSLVELGQSPIDAPLDTRKFSGMLRQLAYHHCEFANRAKHIHTELHWRLHGWSVDFAMDAIDKRIADSTTGLAVLQPDIEMVDLIVHGTNHYWYNLKWLADIQQALITVPQHTWRAIAAKANEVGATHALQMALVLAETLFFAIGPTPNFSMEASPRAIRTARYALKRMGASTVLVHGLRSAVDRSVYRLASATPYGRLTAALRCVC